MQYVVFLSCAFNGWERNPVIIDEFKSLALDQLVG